MRLVSTGWILLIAGECHTGGQGGFTSMLYFNPVTRQGVVAAFNTTVDIENHGKAGPFRLIQQRVFELLR